MTCHELETALRAFIEHPSFREKAKVEEKTWQLFGIAGIFLLL